MPDATVLKVHCRRRPLPASRSQLSLAMQSARMMDAARATLNAAAAHRRHILRSEQRRLSHPADGGTQSVKAKTFAPMTAVVIASKFVTKSLVTRQLASRPCSASKLLSEVTAAPPS